MEERGNNISHVNHHGNHDNGGKKFPTFFLITIIAVVVLIGVLLAVYLLKSTEVSDNGLPGTEVPSIVECNLDIPGTSTELSVGGIADLRIRGYKGSLDQVSWKTENPNVARVDPVSGPEAMLMAIGPGTTTITATDNAVGPGCTDSIIVNVI